MVCSIHIQFIYGGTPQETVRSFPGMAHPTPLLNGPGNVPMVHITQQKNWRYFISRSFFRWNKSPIVGTSIPTPAFTRGFFHPTCEIPHDQVDLRSFGVCPKGRSPGFLWAAWIYKKPWTQWETYGKHMGNIWKIWENMGKHRKVWEKIELIWEKMEQLWEQMEKLREKLWIWNTSYKNNRNVLEDVGKTRENPWGIPGLIIELWVIMAGELPS